MSSKCGTEPDAKAGLRGLDLPLGFDSGDNALESFYIPSLSRAAHYDRSVGYFRSSALSVAARGMARFINGGGTVRLLAGAEISPPDRDALLGKSSLDGEFADRLAARLATSDDIDQRRLEVLGWLARENRLDVRIAIAVDQEGAPIVGGEQQPYFHEKIGVLTDNPGDGVAFQGSVNESATAWTSNFESFSVYTSWGVPPYYNFWADKFNKHWNGNVPGFRVFPLPEAARQELIALAPGDAPDEHDPEEAASAGDDTDVARFMALAPRLVNAAPAVAEATTGVELFPHQRQVVERLAGAYPRSWLVADEVGLGKTISAGMALRRLLLDGEVKRVLILAPANVCRQWQDELFEKFGLWVPRLDGGKVYGAHPDDVQSAGSNPYSEYDVLIASSHLARRPAQQKLILSAAPYDLVVVDEAHHARRQHAAEDSYRPSRLLELLDQIDRHAAARAVWLLTATPMQVNQLELVDLLRQTGLHGPLADGDTFLKYFRELAKDEVRKINWMWLDEVLQSTPHLPRGATEQALIDGVRTQLGAVAAARIERFGTGKESAEELVEALDDAGLEALRQWLRLLSPVGQYVTRHSRETLHRYRELGLLRENLADRDVTPVVVKFSNEEQKLYEQLEALIDRLMAASDKRQGAGFVLTVYRRRLTSSWAAIRRTLTRRLAHERLELDEDQLDDATDELDTANGSAVDDTQAVPLTQDEIDKVKDYIDRMTTVSDSKLDQLRQDINAARSAGHSAIVFSQFTDTVNYLRDALQPSYGAQLATFTGEGGAVRHPSQGWIHISKHDLIEALRARQITVLIANDAASEGINLQSCSYLINFDMPWNPMKAEQRIGRIDRLGQPHDVVHVRNYFIPNTVEQAVYGALAHRIDDFRDLLGALQPILGATERAFQSVFRAPRSERATAEKKAIDDLLDNIDALADTGLDLSAEDPMPIPKRHPSPVTLADLRAVLVDRFGVMLDMPHGSVSWDPAHVSRDADGWTALGTYGHPQIASVFSQHNTGSVSDSSALVTVGDESGPAAAVRADRTPPRAVSTLADLGNLGAPVAHGEAEELANGLVLKATRSAKDRYTAIDRARDHQWQQGIRSRYIALVHHLLAAGCAAGADGTDRRPDPALLWYEFKNDRANNLSYLETFRHKLDVPPRDLISSDLTNRFDHTSPERWSQIRQDAVKELFDLMKEYRIHVLGL